jgi:AmmeMemoRadiSam system protein B
MKGADLVLRQPSVAGRFYPENPAELNRQISDLVASDRESPPRSAICCLVPHAGYRYSGRIAGEVYSRLKLPRRFLLIGPRHFPAGKPMAILSEGAWRTPLGQTHIDAQLASELKRVCPSLSEDEIAHRSEHALEVQLPFLQCLCRDLRFVPIALGPVDYSQLKSLGEAIGDVLRRQPDPVLVIASSDMNHYEPDEITRRKDADAIKFLLALDPHGLFEVVRREGISMCGYGAAVTMLTAARLLGATRATLAAYATSADVNGDRSEVVGYAGVIVDGG